MRNSTRKKALLGVIVLLIVIALWTFGLVPDVTGVLY